MNPKEDKNQSSVSKIEMKSQYMSGYHTFLFSLVMIMMICVVLVLSSYEIPMLLYDESDIYSCPIDHIRMTAADMELEQNAKANNEPFVET